MLAGCEFLLFIILFFGDEKYNLMCMSGIILCGMTLAVVVLSMIFSLIKEKIDLRRAALKALGKHGLKVVASDESARVAYKGIVKLFQGNYPDAEELLMKSLSMASVRQNQLFCVEWLGRLYEETNNRPKLIWCYRKAVELAPENPDAQCRLGQEYFNDGSLSNAVHCFEQALRYDPNNGYAYYSMAKIHIIRGEDDKARVLFGKLLTINENHPLVYAELAIFSAMKGDRDKSEEYCQKAILCGYREPEELNAKLTAIFDFGQAENVSENDLPQEYYRRFIRDDREEAEKGEENA